MSPHPPKTPPAQRLSTAMRYLETHEIPVMPAMIVRIHHHKPRAWRDEDARGRIDAIANDDEFTMTTSNDKHFSCRASDLVVFNFLEPDLKLAIYTNRQGQRIARQVHKDYLYTQSYVPL